MLNIQSVTKKYIGVTAVSDVSFDLPEGRLAALLGPNGSGKTTDEDDRRAHKAGQRLHPL